MRTRLLLALVLPLIASGCTRRYLLFDYDYPARGLASRVQVERRNREPLNAAAPLQVTLHANAPEDSALIVIVDLRATEADVLAAMRNAFGLTFSDPESAAVHAVLASVADQDGSLAPALRIFTGTSRGDRRQAELAERQRVADFVNAEDSLAAKAGAVSRRNMVTALCQRERRTNSVIPTTCTAERVVVIPPDADSLVTLLFDVERGPNAPHLDSYDLMVSWLAYPVLRGVPPSTPAIPEAASAVLRWPASTQCGSGDDAFCREEHYIEFIRPSLLTGTTRFAEINFAFTPLIAAAAAGAVLIASER